MITEYENLVLEQMTWKSEPLSARKLGFSPRVLRKLADEGYINCFVGSEDCYWQITAKGMRRVLPCED